MRTDEVQTWSIRRAEPRDAAALLHLLQQLYDEIDHEVPSDLAAAVAARLLEGETGFIALLAFESDNAVPVAAITVAEGVAVYAGGAIGSIQEFFVERGVRSQGVGRALVDEVRRIGVERAWRRLEVTAPPREPDNRRAVAFYRSNGFETSGPHLKLSLVGDRKA